MSTTASRKGKKGEQEVCRLIHEHTGLDVRRTLAGHTDDVGDITGLTDVTVQSKNYTDTGRALREGIAELSEQHTRSGTPYAAAFIRRPGGRYVVAMTPEQFFALWRDAIAEAQP